MLISIDGLGVSGKTTLARMISNQLGLKNLNTGAIYRCIALEIINKGLDINNIDNVIDEISEIKIDFFQDKVFLNDQDVSKEIRTEKISVCSTKWAIIPEIKEFVREYQKNFIKNNNTVIEGRDIATRIAPQADVKFYLYTDFETRVYRLWNQNTSVNIDEIRKNLEIRDDIDINGGNFVKPADAFEIDTTDKSIEEIYCIMMDEINNKMTKENKIIKR